MITQSAYLFPEKPYELNNLNIGFAYVLLLLIDVYSRIVNSFVAVVLHYHVFIKL